MDKSLWIDEGGGQYTIKTDTIWFVARDGAKPSLYLMWVTDGGGAFTLDCDPAGFFDFQHVTDVGESLFRVLTGPGEPNEKRVEQRMYEEYNRLTYGPGETPWDWDELPDDIKYRWLSISRISLARTKRRVAELTRDVDHFSKMANNYANGNTDLQRAVFDATRKLGLMDGNETLTAHSLLKLIVEKFVAKETHEQTI